jgi:hypothetical protein
MTAWTGQFDPWLLVEAHDDWQVTDRRYLSEGSMALLTAPAKEVVSPGSRSAHSQ